MEDVTAGPVNPSRYATRVVRKSGWLPNAAPMTVAGSVEPLASPRLFRR